MQLNQLDNELQHHGVVGQKWGVRRYQKKDGSLTRKGKKLYKEASKDSKWQQKKAEKMLTKRSKQLTKKIDKKTKKYIDNLVKERDLVNKHISDIQSGKLKAGRDYAVAKKTYKIPYARVGLAGLKFRTAKINRYKLVMK